MQSSRSVSWLPESSIEDEMSDIEVIDMSPEDDKSWGMKNAITPIKSIFGGSKKYYEQRKLLVETTPANGLVDLFYVRSGFQKRFEQAETPVVPASSVQSLHSLHHRRTSPDIDGHHQSRSIAASVLSRLR